MYHLLVTAHDGAWDLPAYEYDRSRFCEHTCDELRILFKPLTAQAIEELKSFPAMFAYEGESHNVRTGYIRRIRDRRRSLLIEYEFDDRIPEFPFEKIARLQGLLEFENWEMNRTHWAIKDEDLL